MKSSVLALIDTSMHVLRFAALLQVPNRIPARIVIRPGVADDIAARLHPHRELVGEAVQRFLRHVEVTRRPS